MSKKWTRGSDYGILGVELLEGDRAIASVRVRKFVRGPDSREDRTETDPEGEQRFAMMQAAPELVEALQGLVRYAEAVRMSAGMGKSQLARLEAAAALLARIEGSEDQ